MDPLGLGLVVCEGYQGVSQEKPPHPNPPETSDRPEGEGTDRGVCSKSIDLKVFSRTQVLKPTTVSSLSPSPPWGRGLG
ncbi:hypothetical protein C6Y56_00125 [Pseudomonas fluorescens]|uniref:Uncharacterized protein n=1 Tax=Pseudomonas fluorescens TaxID=294 RepID=A0A7Z3GXU0_PSEFL|nr:hypothetical protein C6Y56_00125 [Pseudomonas fluorescens]